MNLLVTETDKKPITGKHRCPYCNKILSALPDKNHKAPEDSSNFLRDHICPSVNMLNMEGKLLRKTGPSTISVE